MGYRTINRIGISLSVLITILPAVSSAAVLEEIIVTAQKREQSLQDVSAAVSAVSTERLQSAQINNIEDLQTIVPSINLGNDFNMAKLFIRGVGANTSTTGSATGVAMYVDGAYVSRAEAQLTSLFDLERVEVLRGPQGSLYGRNAVGGSINLVTAKPSHEFEGYGRVTAGDYSTVNGEGAVGGPIFDSLLARAAFKVETHSGYGVNPVTGNDVDDLKRAMFRGQLQYLFNDDVDILVSGEYFTQDDASRALKFRSEAFPTVARLRAGGMVGVNGTPLATAGPAVVLINGYANNPRDLASEVDPATQTDTWSVTSTINWRLNDKITLSNITNYRDFVGFITQDLDISANRSGPATFGGTGFNSTIQRRDIDSEQYSTEFQFKYSSDQINGVLGFFYFHEDQAPVDTIDIGPVLGSVSLGLLANPATGAFAPISATGLQLDGVNVPATPISQALALGLCNTYEYLSGGIGNTAILPKRVCIHSDLKNDAWALFGQFTIGLGQFVSDLDKVSIKLGGRYSSEDVSSANPAIIVARNGIGPILLNTTAGTLTQKSFDSFTPEVGLEWQARDNIMLYYTYSEGFKAGAGENGARTITPPNILDVKSVIVGPEEIQNHEFGVKSDWLDHRLVVNASGFFYDLQGQQINKTISGGAAGFGTIFENAASTEAHGIEVEFLADVSDELRLSGGISWLDSQYVNFLTKDPLDPRNISGGLAAGNAATDFVAPNGVANIQLAGNPTRDSPEWTTNLHAEYDIKGISLPYDGYLTLMGDLLYKDDVFFTEFHRLLEGQPDYTLLDLNLRYTSGNKKIKADFWVKNVTDELVASSTFQLATARTIGVTYLPPRTFGLTLGYNF